MVRQAFKHIRSPKRAKPDTVRPSYKLNNNLGVVATPNSSIGLDNIEQHRFNTSPPNTIKESDDDYCTQLDDDIGRYRFSFKDLDAAMSDKDQQVCSGVINSRRGNRFTTLETAADKENYKLGLANIKMTDVRSPRITNTGNPLDSLNIGNYQPPTSEQYKAIKKRLLRKPLPLNRYKKSHKYRKPSAPRDGEAPLPKPTITKKYDDCMEIQGHASYGSVSQWLDAIKIHSALSTSSSSEAGGEDCKSCRDVSPGAAPSDDNDEATRLAEDISSAQTMVTKDHGPKFTYHQRDITLPDISVESLKPRYRNDLRNHMNKFDYDVSLSDAEEDECLSSSEKSDVDLRFPPIITPNSPSTASSATSRATSRTQDMKLPALLQEDGPSSAELERQRLKLIQLDITPMNTTRSEPNFLSSGQLVYTNKGASSQRYDKNKCVSLKEMAASFQNKMTQSRDVPNHPQGRKILDEKLTKHTSVINENAYHSFARKPKPKPAILSFGVTYHSTTLKTKSKEPCERINENVHPALEINCGKLDQTVLREFSNVSTNSMSMKRRRSVSRDRMWRSNSMTSISSSHNGHISRREASFHKDGSGNGRQRKRGRSLSKNRQRQERLLAE